MPLTLRVDALTVVALTVTRSPIYNREGSNPFGAFTSDDLILWDLALGVLV
jgi:hypothetical protein